VKTTPRDKADNRPFPDCAQSTDSGKAFRQENRVRRAGLQYEAGLITSLDVPAMTARQRHQDAAVAAASAFLRQKYHNRHVA
jgi:hypothetical protein